MTELAEHEFELGGFVFGIHTEHVTVESWDTGTTGMRTSDLDNALRDGVSVDRDYIEPPTWSFDLSTDREDTAGALESLSLVRRAWRADSIRRVPRAVAELRFHLGGRTRKVFGRPRRFSAPPSNRILGGYIPITADFRLVDDRTFDDAEQSFEITATASAVGGLVTPLVTPLTTIESSVPRVSAITVGGEVATDLIVEVDGPISSAYLIIGDVRYDFVGSIGPDDTVVVDSRPWVRSVTYATGGSAAGKLARTTKLETLVIEPGTHPVTFGGIDATGTARARVRWTPAYPTI